VPHDLGRIRQGELFQAAGILNSEVVVHGFPDKRVEEVDPALAVELLVDEIRAFRPHVLLAFHPNGISAHPDHKAMTRHARAAFDASGDSGFRPRTGRPGHEPWQPDRLYYYSLTKSRAEAVQHFRTIQSVDDSEVDLALDVSAEVPRKHAACMAHGTQLEFYYQLQSALGGIDRFWSVEHHIVGAQSGRRPDRLTDLFDGIDTSR
jgi:LmbE family N-acetylglucosaminyl deacetylase